MLGLVQALLDQALLHVPDVLQTCASVGEEPNLIALRERPLHHLAALPLSDPQLLSMQPTVSIIVQGYDNLVCHCLDELHLGQGDGRTVGRKTADVARGVQPCDIEG